jgi:hypothetical protein
VSLVDSSGRPIIGTSAQPVLTIVLEGRTLNFGANTQLIQKLPIDSRRKILEILTTLLLKAAVLFFCFLQLAGCAGRHAARSHPPKEKFWNDCQEVMPARPDGFQHFSCTDVNQHKWQVLVRREGK